jgi:hypothetical protein
MQKTLLNIVQDILSSLDSDEVNSISDTVESMQIARLAEQLFYDIAVDVDLHEHEGFIELLSSGDLTKPCVMTLPTEVSDIEWINYDNKLDGDTVPDYKPVQFMEFQEFLRMTQSLRLQPNTGVAVVIQDTEKFDIIYRKDKQPQFYTTLDGTTLIFDSFDNTVDSTLQKSKIMAFGNRYPIFLIQDNYTPDLDPAQFPYYINRLKVRAFAELKQTQNAEAAGEARRQKVVSQVRKQRTSGLSFFERVPKYGRK